MSLINHNILQLEGIKKVLDMLTSDLYCRQSAILNKSSIGQHFRHILEFYICLKQGADSGIVSYDNRERNPDIETDRNCAINTVINIIDYLRSLSEDHLLILKANYSLESGEECHIQTSLYRELSYALDHTIHHLAIIKIAMSQEKDIVELDAEFGVAPSTVRYRKAYVK